MSKTASKEVSVATSSTAVANFIDDPDLWTGNTGFENITASDLLIPRLTILQKMSPQLDESKPEYIEGAKYGDFCDTATREIYKELHIIPCFHAITYLEWAPRDSKKGLVKNHGMDSSILKSCSPDEKGRQILPNGNLIAKTGTWYVVNLTANRRKNFIPLASTQFKHSSRWLTLATSEKLKRPDGSEFTPKMWFRSWYARTVEEQNAQGSWKSWNFVAGPNSIEIDPSKNLFRECDEFNKQAQDGFVQGDLSGEEGGHSDSSDRM